MHAVISLVHEGSSSAHFLANSRKPSLVAIFATILMTLTSLPAQAQEVGRDWHSVRAAGMGFSTLAAPIGSDSVFSNPATLSRIRNPRSRDGIHEIHFPRIIISAPEAELAPIGETLFSAPENAEKNFMIRQNEQGNSATTISAQIFPSIVFGGKSAPSFLFGTYGESRLVLTHQAGRSASTFDVVRDTTLGAAFGVAGTTRGGTFAYGLSARPNLRYYSSQNDFENDPESLQDFTASTLKLERTIGVGVDAGILFTAADFWLPTFALAVRNAPTRCVPEVYNPYRKQSQTICGSARSGASQQNQNRTLVDPTELGIGFSITPRSKIGADKLNLRLTAEASPIGIPSGSSNYGYVDVPLDRMLRAGAELFLGHALYPQGFALRGGFYAGSATWGFTAELWVLQLEYASYEIETAFLDGSYSRKRQHMLGISTRW